MEWWGFGLGGARGIDKAAIIFSHLLVGVSLTLVNEIFILYFYLKKRKIKLREGTKIKNKN